VHSCVCAEHVANHRESVRRPCGDARLTCVHSVFCVSVDLVRKVHSSNITSCRQACAAGSEDRSMGVVAVVCVCGGVRRGACVALVV